MSSVKILFFSRGRGRGHAIPDLAIAEELSKLEPDATIKFVSYATGAETIREHGYQVIDLGLAENNHFIETLVRADQVIDRERPSLVISHEEFCVIPAAKTRNVPSLFLIDWFPNDDPIYADCLRYANSILFMDEPGYFDEPEAVRGKIEYVGPIVRALKLSRADRNSCREALQLPVDRPIILILPGGSSASSESTTPLFDLVNEAIFLLDKDAIALWIMPSNEQHEIKVSNGRVPQIIFMAPHIEIERTMVAADLVITKATRNISLELGALGIPSVSISHGRNPIDDFRIGQFKTNRALRARGLTAASLSMHLQRSMAEDSSGSPMHITRHGKEAIVSKIRQFM